MHNIVTFAPSVAQTALQVASVVFWGSNSCYVNDNTAHAIAVDLTASSPNALTVGREWITKASSVLETQTHVALAVGSSEVVSTECFSDSVDFLNAVPAISNGGLRLHISDCSVPDIGGLAYQNGVCSVVYNKGVVFQNHADWSTVLHEVGHLLGAVHPFSDDPNVAPGDTGGVMDYYNNKVDGIVQFSSEQQHSLCPVLQNATCRFQQHLVQSYHTAPCHAAYTSSDWGLVWFAAVFVFVFVGALIALSVWPNSI